MTHSLSTLIWTSWNGRYSSEVTLHCTCSDKNSAIIRNKWITSNPHQRGIIITLSSLVLSGLSTDVTISWVLECMHNTSSSYVSTFHLNLLVSCMPWCNIIMFPQTKTFSLAIHQAHVRKHQPFTLTYWLHGCLDTDFHFKLLNT